MIGDMRLKTDKLRKKLEEAVELLSTMSKEQFDGLPAEARSDLSTIRILCEYYILEYKTVKARQRVTDS
jgi:hypothetical protein